MACLVFRSLGSLAWQVQRPVHEGAGSFAGIAQEVADLVVLDATGGAGEFSDGVGRALIESAYRPADQIDFDPERLAALVGRWIEVETNADARRKR